MTFLSRILRFAPAALLAAACCSPASSSAQSLYFQPEPPNYGLLGKDLTPAYRQIVVKDLEAYHDCTGSYGCYTLDLDRETAVALSDLEKAVDNNKGKKLALVLDIDETSLSNYPEMKADSLKWVQKDWDRWAERASAPAIPGTLALYKQARALKVAVFFITGRPGSQRSATEKNLRAAGYSGWAGLTLRSTAEAKTPTVLYKSSARERIARQGYIIVESVGDQFSDLEGDPAAEYSIKLSDPFYFIR